MWQTCAHAAQHVRQEIRVTNLYEHSRRLLWRNPQQKRELLDGRDARRESSGLRGDSEGSAGATQPERPTAREATVERQRRRPRLQHVAQDAGPLGAARGPPSRAPPGSISLLYYVILHSQLPLALGRKGQPDQDQEVRPTSRCKCKKEDPRAQSANEQADHEARRHVHPLGSEHVGCTREAWSHYMLQFKLRVWTLMLHA